MSKRSRTTALTYTTKSGHALTEKQTKFVMLYVESLGNGADSVIAAYGLQPKDRPLARSMSHENLTKPYILEAIRELMGAQTLNDGVVDAELAFVIHQRADLGAKNKAIDMYNKMMGRYELDNKQKNTNLNSILDAIEQANGQGLAGEESLQDSGQECETSDVSAELDARGGGDESTQA